LSNLVHAFNEKISVLVGAGWGRGYCFDFGTLIFVGRSVFELLSFADFTFQKHSNFFDVPLRSQVGNQLKDLLVDFNRLDRILSNNVKDVSHVLLKELGVLLFQTDKLIQNDQLNVVIVLILQKLEVRLDRNLDS